MTDKAQEKQFDVSKKMKELFDLKQKQRAAAKEYFQKYVENPHRPIEDGIPFDIQLQRYSAMSCYHAEYFKPTARHWTAFIAYLSPLVLLSYISIRQKRKKEEILRSGVIKYSDREGKLIY